MRPYYLYQAQVLSGTRHLRTTIETGVEIMEKLQGYTSGLAVPKYLLDTPYGKTPLMASYLLGRDGDEVVMSAGPSVGRFVRLQARNYFYRTLMNRLGWQSGPQ